MDKRKILVVDDNADLVDAVRGVLEARDYAVVAAYSGAECLEKVKAESPDLILLDVMMEDVSKGFDVVQKLRRRTPDSEFAAWREVPIILLTAVQQRTKLEVQKLAGTEALPVQDFVEKPFKAQDLVERIEKALGSAGASA